jgi:hypothetical protein
MSIGRVPYMNVCLPECGLLFWSDDTLRFIVQSIRFIGKFCGRQSLGGLSLTTVKLSMTLARVAQPAEQLFLHKFVRLQLRRSVMFIDTAVKQGLAP